MAARRSRLRATSPQGTHRTLRMTPGMALGATDHIWSVEELINAANEPSDVPPIPRTVQTTLQPGTRRFRLIVGRGGKRGPN